MNSKFRFASTPLVAALCLAVGTATAADKKVLLLAGPPSHGPGEHEFNAGVQLLQKCLAGVPGLKATVALNGWPANPAALEGLDAIIIYSDGETEVKHPALSHLAELGALLGKNTGLGLVHYAVEPATVKGRPEFLRWIGGYFETHRSVNPHWDAVIKSLPSHPVTRGVKPFAIRDEWYFNLRFVEGMKGVTPLFTAVPTSDTMARKNGPHDGNASARAVVAGGEAQTLAWAFDRVDGGRGFGFTGAHFHRNWGEENFRRLVLNATLWLAGMEVPANGVTSTVSASDLAVNLDPKPAKKAEAKK
ncbi:MAG: hypothetical protein EXS38_02595 [Opitutus sp.]|nr:hypothetical protein [Opitutus sp.]